MTHSLIKYFPSMTAALLISSGSMLSSADEGAANTDNNAQDGEQAILKKLSREQDELQADLTEIISDQTDPKVVEMLNLCRQAMNQSIDLLEDRGETGPETLAAQSDVIERIYQAAKQKYSNADGSTKQGYEGVMAMLSRMLGMGMDSGQTDNGQEKGNGDKEGQQSCGGRSPGAAQGTGNKASGHGQTAQEDGEAGKEPRTVPRATGPGMTEMPEEFREALDHYNKTLQQ